MPARSVVVGVPARIVYRNLPEKGFPSRFTRVGGSSGQDGARDEEEPGVAMQSRIDFTI